MNAQRPSTLLEAVGALAADTPYTVQPTDTGFDLHVDLADARWYGLFHKERLHTYYAHRVAVDEAARTYTVTDRAYTLSWLAGTDSQLRPVLSWSAEGRSGRISSRGFSKVWAFSDEAPDGTLRYGKVVDYRFDTEESRALLTAAARQLGYRERQPMVVKVAMAAAVGGAAIAAGVLVLLAVAAVLGWF